MKIIILDGDRENPGDLSWEELAKLGELTVYDKPADEEETIRRIGDGEIVFTNKTKITKAVLDACPYVKYIGVLATGYNVVDCEAAKEKGIPVTNIPAYGTMAVAQYTVALLLEICNQVGHHAAAVAEGRWQNGVDWCFWDRPLMTLEGKTMGIIGFGRIGRQVGRIASAMGMQVLAYSRSECDEGRAIGTYVPLEELLKRSDVISLHCPLFPETAGMIDREAIEKMKDGVILLNTSRGPLVVEQDLVVGLNSGKVRAAAMDVVSEEPIRAENPLLQAKNCFITPHVAWASRESRQKIMDCAVENLKAFLAGEPVNVVNMK